MKWIYIAVGMLVILYIGQMIEYVVMEYSNVGEVYIIKTGAQP